MQIHQYFVNTLSTLSCRLDNWSLRTLDPVRKLDLRSLPTTAWQHSMRATSHQLHPDELLDLAQDRDVWWELVVEWFVQCKYSYLLTYIVTYVALRQSVRRDYSLQSAVVLHSMEWWSHRLSRRHSEVLARAWSLLRMVCTIVVSFQVWSYFFQNTG